MTPDLQNRIAAAIANATGIDAEISTAQPVSGGCISSATCLTLVDGRRFFAKFNPHPLPGMFEQEALALHAIRAVGAIRAPQPVATGAGDSQSGGGGTPFIVMEMIETGPRPTNFFHCFGQQFANFHRQSQHDRFGFDADNYIGSTPQPNAWHSDWTTFFRDNRLAYQIDLANKHNLADTQLNQLTQKLLDNLDTIIAQPDEPPCLLHGDLWGGNYLIDSAGAPVLIDPAVYFGRREADLAMTHLFGGFSSDFYAAYNEAYPLAPGSSRRLDVYKLYHLLNHLNLFGPSYHSQCVALLQDILE